MMFLNLAGLIIGCFGCGAIVFALGADPEIWGDELRYTKRLAIILGGLLMVVIGFTMFMMSTTHAQSRWHNNSRTYSCEQVREFVRTHGRAGALVIALRNGATVREIRMARKCL